MPSRIETPQAGEGAERHGVYLLTHPRSASNLFQTMMAKQPGYQSSGYKLFDAGFNTLMQLDKGPWSEWSEEDRKSICDILRKSFEGLQDEIDDAKKNVSYDQSIVLREPERKKKERPKCKTRGGLRVLEVYLYGATAAVVIPPWNGVLHPSRTPITNNTPQGKQAFIKEHSIFLQSPEQLVAFSLGGDEVPPMRLQLRDEPASPHTNPSSVPDRFLLSMQPIFQVRHPALAFPSMMRAQKDSLPDTNTRNPRTYSTMSMKHSRALYDWYSANATKWKPQVIDADDIMNNPAVVRQLCVETGLDPDAIQYEWEERHEKDPVHARMLSTIYASKGIIKGLDARSLNIETEKTKWTAEWGAEEAENMAKIVHAAMPDYEYLLSQRTHVK
jgi:hypothetical protein